MLYLTLSDATGHSIGSMEIKNDGTGTHAHGNYDVWRYLPDRIPLEAPTKPPDATVKGFARRLGAWALVEEALVAVKITAMVLKKEG